MIIQKVNRTDHEAVYGVGMNISGGTMTLGYPACWDWLATDSLGVAINQPTTSTLHLFAGVAAEDISDDGYGRLQLYGYQASAVMHFGAASVSAGGLAVGIIDGSWSLQTTGFPTDAMAGVTSAAAQVICMENDVSGPGYFKAFIRAL